VIGSKSEHFIFLRGRPRDRDRCCASVAHKLDGSETMFTAIRRFLPPSIGTRKLRRIGLLTEIDDMALAKSDIRALVNHDPNYVLGRTANGTLRAWEDGTGFAVEIDPPDAAWARDLMVSIGRGDISQMSFAFRVGEDSWETVDGVKHRTILSFDEIFDVSPVTYPACPETNVAIRAGVLSQGDETLIREYLRILRFLIEPPAQEGRDVEPPKDGPQRRSLNRLTSRLRVLKLETTLQETTP
jgi:HK97 family phage prohead protease